MNSNSQTSREKNQHDVFCFECHREGDLLNCDSCPRVYHFKCLRVNTLPRRNWTCPECQNTQSSFHLIIQSHSLHRMLEYALQRVKSHPQAQSFLHFTDIDENIIHPMDFQRIERNLSLKKYNSTGMFLSDMKWILHNSIISHGDQSRLTQNARTLLKKARHETTEIEICSDCYLRSAQVDSIDWFIKPCSIPHVLCWAKMKTYQSWPAKVLRMINDEVDVRFFGRHDRARIPYQNCWVLSKEYPGNDKKKTNIHFDRSLAELQDHIEELKKLYGYFHYAPPQTLLSKTKPFKFVPIIDDSSVPIYMTVGNHRSSRMKLADKQSSSAHHEDISSTMNVFDILNQSDTIISTIPRIRSISPTDNKYLLQGLLRKYTHIEPFNPDVKSTMTSLLNAVETDQMNTNELSPPRKKPRKSSCQHRILPCSSLDQHLSPTLPFVPLRPLSVSPPSIQSISEEEPSGMIDSVVIPSSIDEIHSLPTTEENIWPDVLSIDSPSNPPIHMIINNFKDQFEQFLVNLTSQIDSSLRNTQLKYEKDLETIHHSYRTSLNDLHSITSEQVEEMHQSLELQYWQRFSEMRNRYESKLPLD